MSHQQQRPRIVPLGIAFEGSLAALACLLGWWFGRPVWRGLRGGVREIGLGLVATAPMLLMLIVSLRSRWGPLERIRRFVDEVVRPAFLGCSTLDLAVISLAAGLGEELLFRGLIQAVLADRLGVGWGLAIASLVFGLVHAITPTYAILAALLGAYLGGAWLIGGSLLVPAIAHGLYDFIALRVMLSAEVPSDEDGFREDGGNEWPAAEENSTFPA